MNHYFNPRTREGCDDILVTPAKTSSKFQSTHPRRVRLDNVSKSSTLSDFNPRTREGCDEQTSEDEEEDYIFQSTHPRRVRQQRLEFGQS